MIFPKSSHPDRPIFVQPGAGDMRKQINGARLHTGMGTANMSKL